MKSFTRIFLKLLLILFILSTIPYYFSVMYHFEKSSPFTGDQFYNPYSSSNGDWIKVNMHAHTKAFGGLAKGKNTIQEMLFRYDSLAYDVACISNYNFIELGIPGYHYLPVYEHGFNSSWTHQLVINETKAKPFDYPFFQLKSNKQFIIDRLKTQNNLIVLNHANHNNAYRHSDLMYLNNYDLIEGISEFSNSIKQWDTALSSGHAVWVVGNDDSHDISDYHIGVCWTMVQVDSLNNESIIESLKHGSSYATKGWMGQEMNKLKSVKTENGVYKLKLKQKSDSIVLISDHGKVVASAINTNTISYQFKPENSYIRAEIFDTEEWNNYTRMYLNPIIRSENGEFVTHNNVHSINYFLTGLYWLGLLLLHFGFIFIIWKW